MSRKVTPLPNWIPQACELMVKYDLTLRQAAAELSEDLKPSRAGSASRRLWRKPASTTMSRLAATQSSPKKLLLASSTRWPSGCLKM